jgi:hypothetical protein
MDDDLTTDSLGSAVLTGIQPIFATLFSNPSANVEELIAEYVAIRIAISLLASTTASERELRWHDRALGQIIESCEKNRYRFSREPKEVVVEKLIDLSQHDTRLASGIGRVSSRWNVLRKNFTDFEAKLEIRCAHGMTWGEPTSALLGGYNQIQGTDLQMPKLPSAQYQEEMKAIVKEAILLQVERPEWRNAFVVFKNGEKFCQQSMILDLSYHLDGVPFNPRFSSDFKWEILNTILEQLASAGVGEWKVAVNDRDLQEILSYLDGKHLNRTAPQIIKELDEYSHKDCLNLSLAKFWGVTDPNVLPELTQFQHWVRSLETIRSNAALASHSSIDLSIELNSRCLGSEEILESHRRSVLVIASPSISAYEKQRLVVEVCPAQENERESFRPDIAIQSAIAEIAQARSLPPGTIIGLDKEILYKRLFEADWPIDHPSIQDTLTDSNQHKYTLYVVGGYGEWGSRNELTPVPSASQPVGST